MRGFQMSGLCTAIICSGDEASCWCRTMGISLRWKFFPAKGKSAFAGRYSAHAARVTGRWIPVA